MYFTLPDLPGICKEPFSPSFNPHYEAVASESKVWIDNLGILSGEKQRYFSASAFEFLAAHTYPYADREGYRTCCDYLNVTFVIDDYSDDESGKGARQMADSFINALRDPTWDDGTPFARMARESVRSSSHKALILLMRWNALFRFGERLAPASATARQRFIDTFDHYLDATVREAKNREQGTILGLSDYLELRRGNSGVYPSGALLECILGIDLQPEVFNHPALWNLTKIAGDMFFTANVSPKFHRTAPLATYKKTLLRRIFTVTTRNKPAVIRPTTSSPSSSMNEGSIYKRPWTSLEISLPITQRNSILGRNGCRAGAQRSIPPF